MSRPFEDMSDEWMDDLACAVAAAESEGQGCAEGLVDAIRGEFVARGRDVPGPYGWASTPPEQWKPGAW